jgi:hypothetical protein
MCDSSIGRQAKVHYELLIDEQKKAGLPAKKNRLTGW